MYALRAEAMSPHWMVRSVVSVAALCAILIGASSAPSQPPAAVFLEELSWTELRDLIRAGKTTVIVPSGGTEQNGPHMALGKHNVRVRVLSEKIARSLGNALVAPVLGDVPEGRLTPPSGHMRFPGTISVPDTVFEQVLEAAARSLGLHGFRDIVFLGDHGTTQTPQRTVVLRLNREWARTAVRAHSIEEYYRASAVEFPRALKARGYSDDPINSHAGLADTSLMLAVDPRMVHMERLQAGPELRGRDGVVGDPSRASAELGALGVEIIVRRTVDAIRESIARR